MGGDLRLSRRSGLTSRQVDVCRRRWTPRDWPAGPGERDRADMARGAGEGRDQRRAAGAVTARRQRAPCRRGGRRRDRRAVRAEPPAPRRSRRAGQRRADLDRARRVGDAPQPDRLVGAADREQLAVRGEGRARSRSCPRAEHRAELAGCAGSATSHSRGRPSSPPAARLGAVGAEHDREHVGPRAVHRAARRAGARVAGVEAAATVPWSLWRRRGCARRGRTPAR